MERRINDRLLANTGRDIDHCTKEEIFVALMQITKDETARLARNTGDRKLYYISAEFLIGKLLVNNLINLGIYDEVDEVLRAHGKDITQIEEAELEPSLGNGGLGRLASCFLDSIATLGLPGDGIGLNYHFGLFRQLLDHNRQKEVPNPWLTKESWERRQPESFEVPFKDFTLRSVLYDIDIPGYENACNRLHLFDLDSVDESIVAPDGIQFDKQRIAKNLTLFLYPDDSDDAGRMLRIYQQYFMVSSGAQFILKEFDEKGWDIHELDRHVVIQINDTHPSMVIPELIRLLLARGIQMDEAIGLVSRTCAYTNHTILAEALEKWPIDYLKRCVPHLLPIIRELDARVRNKFKDASTYIIDKDDRVHMAHMDIHYCFSVNGVAALHTEILKQTELRNFYDIYPDKFNNKTNGITFRRWLLACNPRLGGYITSLIGRGFAKDAARLTRLSQYTSDKDVLAKIGEIKHDNKVDFCKYLYETQNIKLNPDSIFDVQIKRLHEYKRQQMNALFAIHKYFDIKSGNIPPVPIAMIFGAKAAPAYVIAKDIIHLICCLQEKINTDPEVSPHFKVLMIENYNVTAAAKVIPAADISEQISLASKEASGTGNMKFMLNGALTLGTEDGANTEIHELVGDDNIYIFGKKSDEVIDLYAKGSYAAHDIYSKDAHIRKLVDYIISEDILKLGDEESLKRLHHELTSRDYFMTLLDLKDYIRTKERVYKDYQDHESWNKKALIGISKAGYFSSDRTIRQYNEEIWKL